MPLAAAERNHRMNTPIYSGIITNYVCTAACRHCMFASAPHLSKEYISAEMAEKLAVLLQEAGTRSVHIGGGEPFMNFDALTTLISTLRHHGVGIDYIETNAFWCSDDDFIKERLSKLKALGVETIMVSVDPFHIEFVPLERPIRLCRMLRTCGFDYFIWKERYLRSLWNLDHSRTCSQEELKAALGEKYISETASEYGLGMNGRALFIADSLYPRRAAEAWLSDVPCSSLGDTSHCHLDLYGNIVPSGCPGISADARDYLEENFPAELYPVLYRLTSGGIRALYEYACSKGFVPIPQGYPSRCALCYAMRKYLRECAPSADIAPDCFYYSMEKDDIYS